MAHSPDECERIFISWKWAISIIIAWLFAVATISWAGSAALSNVRTEQKALRHDVDKLKSIDSKLDTLLSRTSR